MMHWGSPFEAAALVWGVGHGRLVASAVDLEKAAILEMVHVMFVWEWCYAPD